MHLTLSYCFLRASTVTWPQPVSLQHSLFGLALKREQVSSCLGTLFSTTALPKMTPGEKEQHRQILSTLNPFSHFCPHRSLALLEDIVLWADGCTVAGKPTFGNRAQLLEDARQACIQGALRVLTVACLGMFVF